MMESIENKGIMAAIALKNKVAGKATSKQKNKLCPDNKT
jgi:hypothetical protein